MTQSCRTCARWDTKAGMVGRLKMSTRERRDCRFLLPNLGDLPIAVSVRIEWRKTWPGDGSQCPVYVALAAALGEIISAGVRGRKT